jgi:hypothetical protein
MAPTQPPLSNPPVTLIRPCPPDTHPPFPNPPWPDALADDGGEHALLPGGEPEPVPAVPRVPAEAPGVPKEVPGAPPTTHPPQSGPVAGANLNAGASAEGQGPRLPTHPLHAVGQPARKRRRVESGAPPNHHHSTSPKPIVHTTVPPLPYPTTHFDSHVLLAAYLHCRFCQPLWDGHGWAVQHAVALSVLQGSSRGSCLLVSELGASTGTQSSTV